MSKLFRLSEEDQDSVGKNIDGHCLKRAPCVSIIGGTTLLGILYLTRREIALHG